MASSAETTEEHKGTISAKVISDIFGAISIGNSQHYPQISQNRCQMEEITSDLCSAYSAESYAVRTDQKKSIYHDDRRIFHRPEFGYLSVQKALSIQQDQHCIKVELELNDGSQAWLWLLAVDNQTIRFQFGGEEPRFDLDSPMLLDSAYRYTTLTFDETGDEFTIEMDHHEIRIGKNPFTFVVTQYGVRVFELETEKIAGDYTIAPLRLTANRQPATHRPQLANCKRREVVRARRKVELDRKAPDARDGLGKRHRRYKHH